MSTQLKAKTSPAPVAAPVGATRLAASVRDIAALPTACMRVVQVANDPAASAGDIAEVVSCDPALAARALRLVNSAAYALPERVSTLSGAVRVLGTDGLRDLALASGAIGALDKLASPLLDMDEFWRTSVHCALVARELGAISRHAHPEQCFLAGLLHDVGALAIASREPEHWLEVQRRLEQAAAPRAGVELEVFGFTRADVGAELLCAWRLPEALVEPVRHIERPAAAGDYIGDAAILNIARALSSLDVARADGVAAPLPSITWKLAGLAEHVAAEVLDQADARWFEVLEILAPGGVQLRY